MAGLEVFADGARPAGMEVFADDPLGMATADLEARRRETVEGAGEGMPPWLAAYLRESATSLGEGASEVGAGLWDILKSLGGLPLPVQMSGDPDYAVWRSEPLGEAGRDLLRGILEAPMVVGAPLMPVVGASLPRARRAPMRYNFGHGEVPKVPPHEAHVPGAEPSGGRPVVDDPRRGAVVSDGVPDLRGREAGGGLPGRLTDPEGRELTAQYIVGQREAGGPSVPLSLDEIRDVIRQLADDVQYVPSQQMPKMPDGRRAGGFVESRGEPAYRQSAFFDDALRDDPSLHRHEGSHLIDNLTLARERLAHSPRNRRDAVTSSAETRPSTWISLGKKSKYLNDEAELTADAMQAYMANPARFKAKYPRLGKWIRDSVNQHPDVAGLIQFNSLFPWATLGGAAGLGALAASGPDDPNL